MKKICFALGMTALTLTANQCLADTKPAVEISKTAAVANSMQKVSLNTATLEQLDAIPGLGEKKAQAVLDYIAPKGKTENGAIQFEIEGTLINKDNTFIRTGLSANASIILDKAENVLVLKEALIQFEDKSEKPFIEIETGKQQFKKQYVELGLSDGIYVQVKSGVTDKDKIKIWNQTEATPSK